MQLAGAAYSSVVSSEDAKRRLMVLWRPSGSADAIRGPLASIGTVTLRYGTPHSDDEPNAGRTERRMSRWSLELKQRP